MFWKHRSTLTHFDNCVQSRIFYILFTQIVTNCICVISDLQIFILKYHVALQTKLRNICTFDPYSRFRHNSTPSFRLHWKCCKRFISRAETISHFCALRVCMTLSFLWTHSWTCIYIISMRVEMAHPILYFVTIWYNQVFTFIRATYNSFWGEWKKCK